MSKPYEPQFLTVADFLRHLEGLPGHWQITFGGGSINFYRAKTRGPEHVDIEFNELLSRDDQGRLCAEDPARP